MHVELHLTGQVQPFEHDVWAVRTEDRVEIEVDGHTFEARVERLPDGRLRVDVDGETLTLAFPDDDHAVVDGQRLGFSIPRFEPGGAPGEHGTAGVAEGAVRPPMPGKLVSVAVAEGDEVEEGQTLGVLEAMKMQSTLEAPLSGTVVAVHVSAGDAVDVRDVLFEVAPPGEEA